jgi:hypothetical protein
VPSWMAVKFCFAKLQYGGWGRNRTGVNGVAVRCMTTLPPSQISFLVTDETKAASLLENERKFTVDS